MADLQWVMGVKRPFIPEKPEVLWGKKISKFCGPKIALVKWFSTGSLIRPHNRPEAGFAEKCTQCHTAVGGGLGAAVRRQG